MVESLLRIDLPSTLESMGAYAFCYCYQLDTLVCPDKITHFGYSTFALCRNLKQIKLPAELEYLDKFLFHESGIETIELPNGVEYADTAAFSNCHSLHKVIIPASVKKFRYNAFQCCENIDTLVFAGGATPPDTESQLFMDTIFTKATLIVPFGCTERYRQHVVWGRFANIVEDTGTDIAAHKSDNMRIYVRNGRIVVEGADGERVQVFDMKGRQIPVAESLPVGIFMVKVGNRLTQKIVVSK